MTSSRIADDSDDHHELVGSAASNVFDEVFSPPARGMEQEMGLFGHAALDLGWAGRLEGPLESSIDDQSDIYGLPLSDMDIDSVLNASLTGVLEGITASSRDELLSAFELEMEPSQALSCPSSPYGEAAAWRALAVPTYSPIAAPSTTTSCPVSPAAPRPRSVSSVRAGQSLLKPSVLTAIRQKAAAAASSATTQLAPPPDRHRTSGALATTGRYWIARSKSGGPLSTAVSPAPVRNRSCKSRRSTVSAAARSRSPPCQLSRAATVVKSLGIKRALSTAFHTSRRTASPVADAKPPRRTASAAQPTSPPLANETVIENMDVSEYILPVDPPTWASSDTLLRVDCPAAVRAISPGSSAGDPAGLLMTCPPLTPAGTQLPGPLHSQFDIPLLPAAPSSDDSFCDSLQLLDDVAGVIAEDVVIVDGPVDDYTDFRIAAGSLAVDPPDSSAATECAPDSNVVIVNLSAEPKRRSFKTDATAIVDDMCDAASPVVGLCGVADNCGDITMSAGGCDVTEAVCDSVPTVAMEVSCKSVPVADDGSCCVATSDEVNSLTADDNVSRATVPTTGGGGDSCNTHWTAAVKVEVEHAIVSRSASAVDDDVPSSSDPVEDDVPSDPVEDDVPSDPIEDDVSSASASAVDGDASVPAEGDDVPAAEDGDVPVLTEDAAATAPVEADVAAPAEADDVAAPAEAADVAVPAEACDVIVPAEDADVTAAAVAGGVPDPSDYVYSCKSGSALLQQLQGRLDRTRNTTARDLIGAELQRLSERLLVGRTRAKHINQRFTRRSFHCTEEEVPFPPTESASLPPPPLIKSELQPSPVKSELQPPSLSKSELQPSPLSKSELQPSPLSKSKLPPQPLSKSKLQPPSLIKSELQPSSLSKSELQPSSLSKSELQPSSLSKPNLQAPPLRKLKLQAPPLSKPVHCPMTSKPNMQSPLKSKLNLQSPSPSKPKLQSPLKCKPKLPSPPLSKPTLQSPMTSKPNLQSPSLSKPYLQSKPFNKLKLLSPPLSKPKLSVASVKLNTFRSRPETRSSRRLQLVNVQRMSQSGERHTDGSAAPVDAGSSLSPDDCATPGCVSSSTELPVSPSEVVVQNCHSEVVMADHSYSSASGGGEAVRASVAGGAIAAGSSSKRKITLSEYKQRMVTSVSSRPGSPEQDGRGWPEPPTLLSTGLPDLPPPDQLGQGAVEFPASQQPLSDQLGQSVAVFPADQIGQSAAVFPVGQQPLSDQLEQGVVVFPVGQQPISDQAAKLEAIICASPPQSSSVATAAAGSSAHIAYTQLLRQHVTSNTTAVAAGRNHIAVNNNSGRVANSCGGSDMSPTTSSISAPDSGMSISSGSPQCPPLSPADPFRYVPEQYSAASSTPATSDGGHSRASSVTKAVIRSERHRSPARRHRAHRRRRSRSSSSSSGSSRSPSPRPRRSRQRSRSPLRAAVRRQQPPPSEQQTRHHQLRLEQQEAIERRVIYVNGLHAEVNENKLLAMFSQFGDITRVKIKERKYPHVVYGDSMSRCYAFITYSTQQAAVDAQNYANINYPDLEVRFGGRREFCLDQYQDTDNVSGGGDGSSRAKETDFDTLLEMEMRRIQESNSQHTC